MVVPGSSVGSAAAQAAVVMASTIITTRMMRMGQALLAFISISSQTFFGAAPPEHTRSNKPDKREPS